MKNFGVVLLLFTFFVLLHGPSAMAQMRGDLNKSSDYTGQVVTNDRSSQTGNLGNLFNMKMTHSYSMMFSSFGGQYQNINAYTNTMQFFFTDRLTGRVDLSLLHSPFGNSYLNKNDNGMGVQFLVRNAELDYQLSERSNIRIQFQQVPSYGYGGINPFSGYYFNDPLGGRNF